MDLALLFLAVSHVTDLPPGLLSSVCYVESHHNLAAIHRDDGGADSIGLCQLHLSTAMELGYRGTAFGLKDPQINAFWAGLYLSHQLHRYNGDATKAIAAYNSGTYRVDANGKPKNDKYVQKVFTAWEEGR